MNRTHRILANKTLAAWSCGLLFGVGLATSLRADNKVWPAAVSGNWSDTTKWVGGVVPNTAGLDSVTFTNAASTTIDTTIDAAWATAGSVSGINMIGQNSAVLRINPADTTVTSLSVGASGVQMNGGNGNTILSINSQGAPVSNFTLNVTANQDWMTWAGPIRIGRPDNNPWGSSQYTKLTSPGSQVIRKTGNNYLILSSVDPSGFNGSFELFRGFIMFEGLTRFFNALGPNPLKVSGGGDINRLQFQYHENCNGYDGGTAQGTFSNNVIFDPSILINNYNNGFAVITGTQHPFNNTRLRLTLSGIWSGNIGGGDMRDATYGSKPSSGTGANNGGVIMGLVANGFGNSLTNNRLVFTGNNTWTSSTASNALDRFPITLASGVAMVVDSDSALGSGNGLLVRLLACRETTGINGYQSAIGLLATSNRTVNAPIRISANYKTPSDGSIMPLYLGSDFSNAPVTFAGDVYIESHDTASRIPLLHLIAAPGGVSTFSGGLLEYANVNYPAGANRTPLTIQGGGKVVLSGTSSYQGTTLVTNATLQVDGILGATPTVTVRAGATLQGTGTISNAVSVAGNLNPGASIGTLTAGSVTFQSGSTFNVEVNGTAADRLVVTGALDVANAALTWSGTLDGLTPLAIATYGTLSGTFTGVTPALPTGYAVDYGTGSNSAIVLRPAPKGTAILVH